MSDIAPATGAVDQGKQQLQVITEMLKRASQPQAGVRQPTPTASPDQLQKKGYNMDVGKSRGQELGFAMQNFGTFIHNSVAQHKQNQIRDAMSEWDGFSHALEKAQTLSGDPTAPDYQEKVQKMLSQDPWIKANLDPANPKAVKRLKNMYKALNVDLLSGDEENVHREGLKKFFKVKSALDKVKGAKDKMDAQKQQAADPAHQAQQFQQSLGKLGGMGTLTPPDPKTQMEGAKAGAEVAKTQQDRYQYKQGVGEDGKTPTWYAFDSTHPDKAQKVTVGGEEVKVGFKPSAAEGKPVLVEGKPVAIMGPQGAVYPGQPGWTPAMDKEYAAANQGYADAEASKQELAGIRANTYMQSREYGVIDNQTGKMVMLGPTEINKQPGRYSPASTGMTAMGKEAVFHDIYYNVDNVREAAGKLKNGFDSKMRAMSLMALRSNDPANAISTFISSQAYGKLTDDQVDYLTAIASLQENAQAIRSVAGMGAGSDMLRDAILRTVPGAGTPNSKVLNRQLDLFKGTAQRLESGVPQVMPKQGEVVSDPMQVPD